jgi:hypothetical protein
MMQLEMITKPFLASLAKYAEAKRVAVVKALNRGALNISNTIKKAMKTTPRMVFGPMVAPSHDVLDDRSEPKHDKKKKGKLFAKKGGKAAPKSNVVHFPSMPGFAPAIDTGRLINSLRVDFAKNNKADPVARVATPVDYAVPLEYGRRENRQKTRRPFMRPAFDKCLPKIQSDVRAAFDGKGGF